MTIEQLRYLKKALAFVFSLVEPDEYIGKCPEADYEAINGLIEGEIERLNVMDVEETMNPNKLPELDRGSIADALSWEQDNLDFIESMEQTEFTKKNIKRKKLTIFALNNLIEVLKTFRPVRKSRTTEPDGGQPGIRQKQGDWCENPRMMDGWISVEGRGASMYIDEFRYCPNCGRKL